MVKGSQHISRQRLNRFRKACLILTTFILLVACVSFATGLPSVITRAQIDSNWQFEQTSNTQSAAEASTEVLSDGSECVANQVIIEIDGTLDKETLLQKLSATGLSVDDVSLTSKSSDDGNVLVTISYTNDLQPDQVIDILAQCDFVLSSESNVVLTLDESDAEVSETIASTASAEEESCAVESNQYLASTSVDDANEHYQWEHSAIDVYSAWDSAKTDGQVIVATLDSGIDYDHPDLAANIVDEQYLYNSNSKTYGYDAVDDLYGHGTHVAGTIAAVANNGTGVAGVSYNAKILPIKITYGSENKINLNDVITAIDYVVSLKQSSLPTIRVINMSLGSYTYSAYYEQAIQRAIDADIVVVAAAGNEHCSATAYPAAYSGVIGVSAYRKHMGSYMFDLSYSNYGSYVDLSAPGTDIYSTTVGGTYGTMSGTSMSTPVVSGVAALVASVDVSFTAEQITTILESSAKDWGTSGKDAYYGYGAVDAAAAVALATNTLGNHTVTVDLTGIENPGSVLYVDGAAYDATINGAQAQITITGSKAQVITLYTYNTTSSDTHQVYPTHMYVWLLSFDVVDGYTATRVTAFDDILQYAGTSIRLTGNKGIRMITGVPTDVKNTLAGSGYQGWILQEYGTVIQFDDTLAGADVVLSNTTLKNYAYKRGVADPVYSTANGVTKYTNVLVGFSDAQCSRDLSMRPYMILSNSTTGEQITIYGGTTHRSIGYVALQNKDKYSENTAAGQFIWGIIRAVYGNTYG